MLQLSSLSPLFNWSSIKASCFSMSGNSTSKTVVRILLYQLTIWSRELTHKRRVSWRSNREAAEAGISSSFMNLRYLTSRRTAWRRLSKLTEMSLVSWSRRISGCERLSWQSSSTRDVQEAYTSNLYCLIKPVIWVYFSTSRLELA